MSVASISIVLAAVALFFASGNRGSGCGSSCCSCNCSCECCVGGNNIRDLRWLRSRECVNECDLRSMQCLADNGVDTWRLDPVAAAVKFCQNCFIPQEIRCSLPFLRDKVSCNGKCYVLLGFRCSCDVCCELCQPVRQDECGIWICTRYCYINRCCPCG